MTDPHAIDWSRADRSDISDDAIRAAIGGTLVDAPGAGNVLTTRLVRRCVHKVITALFGKYPDVSEHDMEQVVQDAAADVVMQVKAGKLTEFRETPTGYLYTTADHKIQQRARQKKGHEVPFSQLDEEPHADDLRAISTAAFITTLSPPRARPERVAIRREMIRALGAQVGRLPKRMRQVVARVREGLSYRQIARELEISENTVRSVYDKAEGLLQRWISPDGVVSAFFLKKHPELTKDPTHTLEENLLTVFLTSLSEDCYKTFSVVHFRGKRVSEAVRVLGDCRAAIEGLLAYAYWAMHRKGGLLFPRDFLAANILEPHPHYKDHAARFTYW